MQLRVALPRRFDESPPPHGSRGKYNYGFLYTQESGDDDEDDDDNDEEEEDHDDDDADELEYD